MRPGPTGSPATQSSLRSETGGHQHEVPARTTSPDTITEMEAVSMPTIPHLVHLVSMLAMLLVASAVAVTAGRRPPVASASLYEPANARTLWWISLRCPWCGAVHLHRVREEHLAAGPRRAGCGRKVWVVVRRTYRAKRDAE